MPRTIYKTADGKRVPSVTTIVKQLGWSSGGLIYWANQAGLDGLTLDEARNTAAGAGTIAHAMIEAHYRCEDLDLSGQDKELLKRARRAYENYMRDAVQRDDVVSCESPMVSEELRFGGTHDLVYRDGNEYVLRDFKTGAGLYSDSLVQVAGYGLLWNELHPESPIGRYELHRIHSESSTVVMSSRDAVDMAPAFDAFRMALKLYDIGKQLKKMV